MPVIIPNQDGDFEIFESGFDTWVENCSRVMLHGPPISGKTTSLMSFPAPRHILVAPREQGASSIREDKGTRIYTFKFPTTKDATRYQSLWRAVQEYTTEIIEGNYGEVETFAIDGLHKLYYLVQKSLGYTASSDSREFGRYHETFLNYLDPILSSNIPHVVATCYDGQEIIDDGDSIGTDKKKMGVWPGLPGRMAKEIMGSFPLVFHTERIRNGKNIEYRWQFRAGEKVQGVGGHFPREIADAFPEYVKPDWMEVVKLIKAQTKIDINKEINEAYAEKQSANGVKNKSKKKK